MTYLPTDLTVTVCSTHPHALHLAVAGDLDYESARQFTHETNQALDSHHQEHGPLLRDLHLDFSGLTGIDSSALSALLLLHRRTHPAGVTLHLDHRPVHMTRILELTGIADHLTQDARTPHTAAGTTPEDQVEKASAP
ncbi:STAS domain-containing protein [Streptomyces bikiniensis]|uniref:STAS domain-containing protein n=1 Tax=Streptomyces bikiniensis TaxID=1896 RepID=UPI00068DC916|nr:STAS domain-containing protein [Streptomyces bikiniensis]